MQNKVSFLNFQGTLVLHPGYTSYMTLISDHIINKNQSFFLSFHVTPLQTLRYYCESKKTIFTVHFGPKIKFQIYIERSNQNFSFQNGNYVQYIGIQKYDCSKKQQSQIYHKELWKGQKNMVQIELLDKNSHNFDANFKITLQIGSKKIGEVFKSQIANIIISNYSPQNFIETQNVQILQQQGPLDTLPINNPPPIKNLPQYSSFQQSQLQGRTLYLCHDMKGGYIQDTDTKNAYPQNNNSYRALHLANCYIFNYFSHHLITIPPQHWRRACKKAGCLCLGTFIVEGDRLKSKDYLNERTVNILAYLCKRYKFDGYLINIQSRVHSIQLLIQFLASLASLIHAQIKNSKIIWYDSISCSSGQVKYQNQLNHHNQIFYELTDGIFLNYWWNQAKLNKSLQNYVNQKPIYVGSDCFGRGTYGGGQFNTYKAIRKIQQIHKKNLRPALFAPGYTYEGQSQNNKQLWKMRQKSMYRGLTMKQIKINYKDWSYSNTKSNGFTWNQEGQWAVTSFSKCQRIFQCKINKIGVQFGDKVQIQFMCQVKGTGPDFADPYKIIMEVKQNGHTIDIFSTSDLKSTQNPQIVKVSIRIDASKINDNTTLVIIQQGTDAQNWGGHYGSRFRGDTLFIRSYFAQKDWTRTLACPAITIPYHTNWNMGHGQSFFYQGKKLSVLGKKYNYLSDMQIPTAYLLNHPLNVQIQYNDGYIGGNCLSFNGSSKIILGKIDRMQQNKTQQINLRIVYKNVVNENKINCKIVTIVQNQRTYWNFVSDNGLNYGWRSAVYQISAQFFHKMQTKLLLQLNDQKQKILLGQLSIFLKQSDKILPQVQKLLITYSHINPPIKPLCFDLQMKLSRNAQILIRIGDQFICYGHADQFNNNIINLQNLIVNTVNQDISLKVLTRNSNQLFTLIKNQVLNIYQIPFKK